MGVAYIRTLDCDDIYFNIFADRTPPIEITLSFTGGGSVQTHGDGRINIDKLSITIKLTLVPGEIPNPFNGTDSVIDLFSWVPTNGDPSEYIQVELITGSAWDAADVMSGVIRAKVVDTLTHKDPFFPWRMQTDP